MDPADAFFTRLALTRGWISRKVHDRALMRVEELQSLGLGKTAEDVLRESGDLDEERLRILRRLLSRFTRQARIGDYIVVRRIGVGGTGTVFEARHRRIGRRVAIKVLFPRLEKEPGFTERFLREARVLARIDHPNVVHAYDAGKDGIFYYIAMEMVQGESLSQILQRRGCLRPEKSLGIVLAVARALRAIHGASLLHRDVKPANILISRDGTIKLVDLGLYFADWDPQVLWEGRVFGTPKYMSPEQVRGDPEIDARADLYSLGATWYHALTGRPPFEGKSPREIARFHVQEDPIPPRSIRPEVPPAMEKLVLRLLSKQPEKRPASARETIEALERLAGSRGEPEPTREGSTGRGRLPGMKESERVYSRAGALLRRVPAWAWVLLGCAAFLFGAGLIALRRTPGERGRSSPDVSMNSIARQDRGENSSGTYGDLGRLPAGEEERVSGEGPLARKRVFHELQDRLLSEVPTLLGKIREVLARSTPSLKIFRSLFVQRSESSPDGVSKRAREELLTSPASRKAGALPWDVPEELESWVEEAASAVEQRFLKKFQEMAPTRQVPVLFQRNGAAQLLAIRVERGSGGLAFIDVESGNAVSLREIHPATVIVWGALSGVEEDPPDHGVAYALSVGRADLARRILRSLPSRVPDEARAFLAIVTLRPSPADGAEVESYMAPVLAWVARAGPAREALRTGAWKEALALYEALLPAENLPASLDQGARVWTDRRERARELLWATSRFFNVPVVAVDPLASSAVTVEYAFESRRELQDFRFRPRKWAIRRGRLVRSGSGIQEPMDTVAVFRPPLAVEGTWVVSPGGKRGKAGPGAWLMLSFAGLSIGLGGAQGAFSLFPEGGPEEGEFLRGKSTGVGGSFRIEVERGRVRAALPGGVRVDTATGFPVWDYGRLTLRMELRSSLEALRITGPLHPIWARARIRLLEEKENEKNEKQGTEGQRGRGAKG